MAKGKSRIILTYRIDSNEMLQVCVDAASSYPDAMDQARATARANMRDLLADIGFAREVEPTEMLLIEPDPEP